MRAHTFVSRSALRASLDRAGCQGAADRLRRSAATWHPWLLALAMLAGCSCDHAERPGQRSHEDVGARVVDRPAEARHAESADQCNAACAAAASQTCEKLAAGCKYDPTSWVHVGKHTLRCRAACAASCLGPQTGIPMCVEQCSAEGTIPASVMQ